MLYFILHSPHDWVSLFWILQDFNSILSVVSGALQTPKILTQQTCISKDDYQEVTMSN